MGTTTTPRTRGGGGGRCAPVATTTMAMERRWRRVGAAGTATGEVTGRTEEGTTEAVVGRGWRGGETMWGCSRVFG